MKRSKLLAIKMNFTAYLLLFPAFGMFIYFVCIPAVQSFYLSLTKWDGISPKQFVGFDNYINLLVNDPLFWGSVSNSLLWALASCIVPVWVGLILASFLVRGNVRFNRLFQVIFFLPQVISTVVAAVIWEWIYDPMFGPLNALMNALGLGGAAWLGDPHMVMIALFIIYIWQSFGFSTVIFLSAIQGVDTQLYDASRIDGCGSWGQFWNVTLPGIRQAMTSTTMLMAIWSFQVFDLVMTTTRGGPGYSSYVVSYYVFDKGFIEDKVGFGAAASIFLTAMILIVSRIFMYVREKE